jgi:hypothetical protein
MNRMTLDASQTNTFQWWFIMSKQLDLHYCCCCLEAWILLWAWSPNPGATVQLIPLLCSSAHLPIGKFSIVRSLRSCAQ